MFHLGFAGSHQREPTYVHLESMAGLSMAIAAGGALKSGKTTPLMTGDQGVEALKKAGGVAKTNQAAR